MDYRRHAPAADLAGFVEHYWSVTAPAPAQPLRAVLVPDGRSTVQFCLGEPGRRLVNDRPAEPNADVWLPAGVEPMVLEQRGASHYVGVQFTPWGARALFPRASARRARVVDAIGPLPDKRALASNPAAELDRWLRASVPESIPSFALHAEATARIDADPSSVNIGDLSRSLGVSPSTLYRAFRDGIGLTPKQYVQVMRFRRFTDAVLAETSGRPAALLAALAGYADQAHASRDFSRFTGMSASAFRDTYDGIARLMALPDTVDS